MDEQLQELKTALWNSADILRSKMDANEYKNYTLGLIFYKYLSDKTLHLVTDLLEKETNDLSMALKFYQEGYNSEDREALVEEIKYRLEYFIEPRLTYTALMEDIEESKFQLENLEQGFGDVERGNEAFNSLFEDVDLYSKKLGNTINKQNETISNVMLQLTNIDLANYSGDVLGDAYEYLIGEFASDSGKNAGEFYTPQAVSRLITRIVLEGKENKKGFSIYDPAMGSGSLMLNAKRYSTEPDTISYIGQELNNSTYNLARMNMILHDVPIANQRLNVGDTLADDWPEDEPTNFDSVVMNPPYSAKWSADKGFELDPRFSSYGLAPKSKADFAFLLHGFYHLKDTGVMGIVLPHGVLFRGASEGKIRQKLLEEGAIDTVIGLPAGIFYNTSIPTTVIILKKKAREQRDVLFIDASNDFEKRKAQNFLTEKHINKIIAAYNKREDIEKYAKLATYQEIIDNDYNLNIPRYVDTFEEEEPINLAEVGQEILKLDQEIAKSKKDLFEMMNDLVANTDEADKELKEFMAVFAKVGGIIL